ncbi:hypothetical protein [Kocuria marina]
MEASARKASAYERGIVNMVETLALSAHVGEEFTATVVEVKDDGARGTIIIREPAVEVTLKAPDLPLGKEVRVRLVRADVAEGRAEFELVSDVAG